MDDFTPEVCTPMPFCEDSERGILGAILNGQDAVLDEAASVLTAAHFHHFQTRKFWEEMMAMRAANEPIDLLTVSAWLRERGVLEKVGAATASELLMLLPHHTNWRWYLERLQLFQTKRAAIKAGCAIIRAASDPQQDDRMKVIGHAEEAVGDLHSGVDNDEVKSFSGWLHEAVDFVEAQVQRGGSIPGLSTGIPALDQRTLGISPGESWIIAGGTSDGKTALAMQFARALFMVEEPTAYYLTESSGVRLTLRVLASVARVSMRNLFTGQLTRGEQEAVSTAMGRLRNLPFYLRHKPGISLQALLADMRLMERKHGVNKHFIDYIQRIDNSDRESREQQVAEISRRLTDHANKGGKSIVMLSQLNENGMVRESRAPTHDADTHLTVSCPVEKDGRGNVLARDETRRLITISKARNAERGGAPILCHFNGALQTFTEIEKGEDCA